MNDETPTPVTATTAKIEGTERKRNPNIVGSMWKRKGTNSNGPYEFISGPVELGGQHYELLIRKNNFPKSPSSPHYKVYINDRKFVSKEEPKKTESESIETPAEKGLF